jgi:hypothetical protein
MPMGSHNDDEVLDTRRRFPMEFESRERVARVRLDSYEFKKSVSRFDPHDPYHLAIALTWRQFLATLLELYLIVRVPAAAAAGQLRLRRRSIHADQAARLSRFRRSAPQGPAGLIGHFYRIRRSNLRNGSFRFRRLPPRDATHHSLPQSHRIAAAIKGECAMTMIDHQEARRCLSRYRSVDRVFGPMTGQQFRRIRAMSNQRAGAVSTQAAQTRHVRHCRR